ncbi:ABC transporter permease subunit [Cellulomonas marina]|uniref:ABC-2 type transport system permease protein n=1 Tax=Cellulomonas marina TaxID=988821 RepID=A0A1I0X4G3_9CELL|nr:ABC transporter permease subunit [Cellulomonas marina]GIG28903.1 ABC transporter permease [Cellulomonas marina]SFA95228.1 ABC-2 type transport system permease protein [Cellulomonas marina]
MSTATATATTGALPPRTVTARPVTFGRVLRSEWIKLWSLRSTWWTVVLTVVAFVGLVAAMSGIVRQIGGDGPADPATGAELSASFVYSIAVQPASLAAVTLGVLAITGEYTTGMIRSTFAAVPRRLPALWAKAVVVFLVMAVTALVAVALGYAVSTLILSGPGLALDLDLAESWRVLLGSVLYLATVALFAFAIGAIIRHSAGALATIFGLLLVVENVVAAIPWEPLRYVRPFLPASSGARITLPDAAQGIYANPDAYWLDLSIAESFGILVAWTVVLLAIAAVLMRRRDA